jgi:peptidoglycan biosynthesis protein MviN/MurJ (putative lipid II flippase)
VTQGLNLILIGWLAHAGLALAIGLAACLNATLLYRGLRQHGIYIPAARLAAVLLPARLRHGDDGHRALVCHRRSQATWLPGA